MAELDVTTQGRAARSIIVLAGQYASVDGLLTGRENLELAGLLCHLDKAICRQRARQALKRMLSGTRQSSCCETIICGLKQRLPGRGLRAELLSPCESLSPPPRVGGQRTRGRCP